MTAEVLLRLDDCLVFLRDSLPAGDAGLREFTEARDAVAELIYAADALVNKTASIKVTSRMDEKQAENLAQLRNALECCGVIS